MRGSAAEMTMNVAVTTTSPSTSPPTSAPELRLQLIGSMTLLRAGEPVALPPSRKVRALTAYLALTERGATRSKLCELLWDAPSDPRGELRWCLSRLRSIVDGPERTRVQTRGERIVLDLGDCEVDVLQALRVLEGDHTQLALEDLQSAAGRLDGELLEGLHIEASPLFTQWLGAERRRLRTLQCAALAEIARRAPPDSQLLLACLGQWLKVEPFKHRAHELLLAALVRQGRAREAEEHLAAAIRLFEAEGLEWLSIREAWRAAKKQQRPAVVRIEPPREAAAPEAAPAASRASICVMPFLEKTSGEEARSSFGDGLADDVTTRLAKLRALFVIARGSAFALGDRQVQAEDAARILSVDYLASGSIHRRNGRIAVKVELTQTQRQRLVWSEGFECSERDALRGIEEIGESVVAAIAREVETAECHRAVLKAPNSLDAWEAYHRGLWHLYRFNSRDNDRAEHFFRMSAQRDPTFARAHAALSFVHFQNAFLHRQGERPAHIQQALETAGHSVMADDRDPAAHWAMGRVLWLLGSEADSIAELSTCLELSPSFALGHYTLGFVQSQSGDAQLAIESVDHSRRLSPFDPLTFAMHGARAIAHLRRGEVDQAIEWGVKAAARPNAHAHILTIASFCLAVGGRLDDAQTYAARVRAASPNYGLADFLNAFRFAPDAQALFQRHAAGIGFF